jgi:hypothetical protein
MHKALHPSGGVSLSNLHCWRGKWLCHYGDGVCKVVCAFCAALQLVTHQSGLSYVKNVRQHNLKMRFMLLLFASHWLAPYLPSVTAAAHRLPPPLPAATTAATISCQLSTL